MIGFGHNYLTTKEVEGRVSSTGKLISSFAFHVIKQNMIFLNGTKIKLILFKIRFDYEYNDIYDEDYWNYNDQLYERSEKMDLSISKNRQKRSLGDERYENLDQKKEEISLKRTNSASSVLGLNILLYQNENDYRTLNWTGVVQNSFVGFKVS